jgi:drug/metabolite transporter (DMT)-like permease
MPRSLAHPAPPMPHATTSSLDPKGAALYATLILVWGTSWIAIHHQLGVVAPVVSLLWRFVLAASICMGLALLRRERMAFGPRLHLMFALVGVLMFSTNFLLFYLAGRHVPTGLLAVVFALASPINLGLSALFFRGRVEPRVLAGAALGVTGVAALYAPQIAGAGFDMTALGGLGLALAGTLCFCLGNMASSVVQNEGVSDYAATAWGMSYSVVWLLALCLATGSEFAFDLRVPYVASLLWLSIGSSAIAFIAYLALIKRIGPGRAGFATVLFPVVALAISSAFEDYHWSALSILGLALVAAGNVVVLGLARKRG